MRNMRTVYKYLKDKYTKERRYLLSWAQIDETRNMVEIIESIVLAWLCIKLFEWCYRLYCKIDSENKTKKLTILNIIRIYGKVQAEYYEV